VLASVREKNARIFQEGTCRLSALDAQFQPAIENRRAMFQMGTAAVML